MQGLTLIASIAAEKQTLIINARVDVKLQQSHWSVKCSSRAPGHSASLKGMLRTITMHGLSLAAIIAAEKQTLL